MAEETAHAGGHILRKKTDRMADQYDQIHLPPALEPLMAVTPDAGQDQRPLPRHLWPRLTAA